MINKNKIIYKNRGRWLKRIIYGKQLDELQFI